MSDAISTLVQSSATNDPSPLVIAGKSFPSRLFVGTGKFASPSIMARAVNASCSGMVTVALRRVDLDNPLPGQDPIAQLPLDRIQLLPNTSGARNAEEAIRLAHLARNMGGGNWLKLEVTPDPVYLLPDPVETLLAARSLVKDGFIVLPYIHADPVLALRLQDEGCATVMPLGAPIGTGHGLKTIESLRIIIEQARVPVVVDAGIGEPSHAAHAMELGAHAVLVNTAIAVAADPVRTAAAFALAVVAGRESYLYGMNSGDGRSSSERWSNAHASGPLTGFLNEEKRSHD